MAYLPPLNGGRLNASIGGNTAGASTLVSSGTMMLAGGNNVTLSQNGNTISFNAAGAAQASINFSASNASANLASVNFANSYNMSFGLTNGSQIFGSASFAQSAQTQNNIQALVGGTVAQTASTGTVTFGNANGVTFGMSNNNVMTASVAAAAAGSNTIGASGGNVSGNVGTVNGSNFSYVFAGGNNITLSQSITNNSATLTINGPIQSVQTQNVIQAVSASGGSANSGTITFANSNSITFGMNNGVITASAAPDGIQGIMAAGSNVGTGTVSFANSNNVSFGLNGSVLTASAGAGGGVAIAGGGTTYSTGTLGLNAGGGISLSSGAQSLTISAPAVSSLTASYISLSTSGNTIGFIGAQPFDGGISGGNSAGVSATNITGGMYLVGGNNITLSQTTGVNGATITISGGAAGGGAAATISNWEPNLLQNVSLTTGTLGTRTVNFFKLQVPGNVYASQLLQLVSATMSTSSNSTGAITLSMQAGIYSANGSTLSLITQSSGSGSVVFTASGTNGTSNWTGLRGVSISMPVSFSGGNFWLGLWSNSTYANMTGYVSNQIVMNNSYTYNGFFNQASNITQGIQEGVGYYSVSSAALPAAAPMSQIYGQNNFANGRIPYLNFKNLTW